ncbi:MAG: 6,7-dimethyl-8-ribityllumazine synthase [Candidatus Eisenbacteria bacterium]|nr:6,7-dimethyl-8-ribityllumazine synthase [Candidatus Eisenbacteria bacterium]
MPKETIGSMDARGKRFCIVASRYGRVVTDRLVHGALECIRQHGGDGDGVEIYWTPGSFEIPLVAKLRAAGGGYDAVLALGCILRGETSHNEYIASEVAKGLAHVNLETQVPTVFGVLTVDTLEQGLERAGAKGNGRGYEAAQVAIEMADLVAKAKTPGSRRK